MKETIANINSHEQPLLAKKIAVLDGLRGIAILLVLGYHYLSFFSFGWIGVDLFFVLSGFLITGKLAESIGRPDYFSNFYLKRIKRIAPLYLSVLTVFFVVIPLLAPSLVTTSWRTLIERQAGYWTFTANIDDALHGWPQNISLIHFWSLACEAQFYLLWPWVMYLLYPHKKWLLLFLLIITACCILFRIFGADFFNLNFIYRYVLLPCRLDAFCAGAALYLFVQQKDGSRYRRWILVLPITILIVAITWAFTTNRPWHFGQPFVSAYGYTLNAVFWCCLAAAILETKDSRGLSFLKNPLLLKAGKYSYGMYVFHLPVYFSLARFAFFNHNSAATIWLLAGAAFIITAVCSWLSYHLLEKRFLILKPAN